MSRGPVPLPGRAAARGVLLGVGAPQQDVTCGNGLVWDEARQECRYVEDADCRKLLGPASYAERQPDGTPTGYCIGCGKNSVVDPNTGGCSCLPGYMYPGTGNDCVPEAKDRIDITPMATDRIDITPMDQKDASADVANEWHPAEVLLGSAVALGIAYGIYTFAKYGR